MNLITKNEVEKPDNATLIVRRVLNASPELAFEAWTSAEHVKHWMRPEPGMVIPWAMMDVRVGGKFRIQMQNEEGEYFTAVGEFREVQVPERLVYTWDWEKDGSGEEFGEVEGKTSLITVEFLRRGDRTELVLMHTRFATVESRDSHAGGWSRIVETLAEFLEKK
ncbi:SRPBCC domain-containing protein [Phragmitibacter flavus]|uniref:SRPBCC domain-containing protein n=1 Tax=Phragmitibacter flavus TaxID=2576071 RepID=A0A5R8K9X2_9BACT|nr:SRPBCC domain-containing protein [Phragmitibacter flavus]TLD69108.1 SRPBCC domain-containing protein [Phragmitibacter flavus]